MKKDVTQCDSVAYTLFLIVTEKFKKKDRTCWVDPFIAGLGIALMIVIQPIYPHGFPVIWPNMMVRDSVFLQTPSSKSH